MGKIRLQDLARKMGVPEQDLMFKLRSIGVRVEGEDAAIDSDIIQAILQGKRLPQPREVILRDQSEEAEVAEPSAGAPSPAQQRPASPLRPFRRRALIQRVEKPIREIPTKESPADAPASRPAPCNSTRTNRACASREPTKSSNSRVFPRPTATASIQAWAAGKAGWRLTD